MRCRRLGQGTVTVALRRVALAEAPLWLSEKYILAPLPQTIMVVFQKATVTGLPSDPPLKVNHFWSVKWKLPLNTERLKSDGTEWLGATKVNGTESSQEVLGASMESPGGGYQ